MLTNPVVLAKDTIDARDIDGLVEWLKTYPRLTKGEKTIELEKAWAKTVNARYAVFVNSGSSANLLAIYALIASGRMRNKKVVVPALSWITDISPVIQFGLEPVLCDCNLSDLSVDRKKLLEIFEKEKPAALILVTVLGLVPEMDEISTMCKDHGVILIVDNCESQGSTYVGRSLESFGLMATCSAYFGHIISTIEGGMITTDDYELYCLLKMLRSHGWDRDLDADRQFWLRKENNVAEFNSLYTFYETGFNVRSTDLQAFIGLGQLQKLPAIVSRRNNNYGLYRSMLSDKFWKPRESSAYFVSNLGYPLIHRRRNEIVKCLGEHQVECRPLISGSMGKQPFFVKRYGAMEMPNADYVTANGMYLPNHPYLTYDEVNSICQLINQFEE